MTVPPPERVSGIVLAGGKARRMGGTDKGLIPCGGRPLISYAIEALRPLCGHLFINANRSLQEYERFGLPLIQDSIAGFQGPLAGILSGLETATTPYLLVSPCDCPRLETATLARLLGSLEAQRMDIALASDGERLHPVVMALRTHLASDLAGWLASGKRRIDAWARRHRWIGLDLSDAANQFVNINTPRDLAEYEGR